MSESPLLPAPQEAMSTKGRKDPTDNQSLSKGSQIKFDIPCLPSSKGYQRMGVQARRSLCISFCSLPHTHWRVKGTNFSPVMFGLSPHMPWLSTHLDDVEMSFHTIKLCHYSFHLKPLILFSMSAVLNFFCRSANSTWFRLCKLYMVSLLLPPPPFSWPSPPLFVTLLFITLLLLFITLQNVKPILSSQIWLMDHNSLTPALYYATEVLISQPHRMSV